ncbi:MAG: hypothetical protein HY925_01890, partial [Elusimicrobia bacterium]|nr:hypothetical protein [Elusimicrobiota bacterium]
MIRNWKWNVFRVVAVGLVAAMFGAISCGDQGKKKTGDETAPESGP